ncbi:MAG: hypothetical protein ACREM6_11475 [Vulcanimicrobiaceae bacterium]
MDESNGLAPERAAARAFVLGGNSTTLAYTSSLVPEKRQVTAILVPLAWTPVGAVLGTDRQRVQIAADNVAGWVEQTFGPDDERAFLGSVRDLEMLVRVGWHADDPDRLREELLVNPEDVPEDVLDGLGEPPVPLAQCAICRRMCVRDDFVWGDRQLCAWDYHATVFGKRGPWRGIAYEDRLFATVPRAAYVAPLLLDELGVEAILIVRSLAEDAMRRLVNLAIEAAGEASYLAVRGDDGYTLLRERPPTRSAGSA